MFSGVNNNNLTKQFHSNDKISDFSITPGAFVCAVSRSLCITLHYIWEMFQSFVPRSYDYNLLESGAVSTEHWAHNLSKQPEDDSSEFRNIMLLLLYSTKNREKKLMMRSYLRFSAKHRFFSFFSFPSFWYHRVQVPFASNDRIQPLPCLSNMPAIWKVRKESAKENNVNYSVIREFLQV